MNAPLKDQDPLPAMTRDRWLRKTRRELNARMLEKFMTGRATYGTDIGKQTVDYLIDAIEQEAIDTLMYVRELKRRRQYEETHQTDLPL